MHQEKDEIEFISLGCDQETFKREMEGKFQSEWRLVLRCPVKEPHWYWTHKSRWKNSDVTPSSPDLAEKIRALIQPDTTAETDSTTGHAESKQMSDKPESEFDRRMMRNKLRFHVERERDKKLGLFVEKGASIGWQWSMCDNFQMVSRWSLGLWVCLYWVNLGVVFTRGCKAIPKARYERVSGR